MRTGVTGIFVNGVDVTERVAAQEATIASAAQFRTFAQSMPNHVWTAAPNGQLDWFNERVFEYSGLGDEDLLGDGWTQIVHPDDLHGCRGAVGGGRRQRDRLRDGVPHSPP